MTHVVAVTWRAEPGNEDRIAEIIGIVGPLSNAEPGCVIYRAHRSLDDPRVFFLYEEYVDEAAFQAHRETDHFQRWVLGEAIPLLERREHARYTPMDAGS